MRARPYRRILCLAGLVLLAATLVYVVVLPLVDARWHEPERPTRLAGAPNLAASIQVRAGLVFYTLWIFALGTCFGSFVNVVAFRWPRGRTILGNSHCPNCNMRIRLRDNIPILSWFLLEGRCRTCRLRIAPRYLIAECIAGCLFVVVLFAELLSGGANLPTESARAGRSLASMIVDPPWELVRLYVFHMVLLTLLWTATLVKLDAQRMPKKLLGFGLLMGIGMTAVWPGLHPVAWAAVRPGWLDESSFALRLETGLIGMVAGATLGWVLSKVCHQRGGAATDVPSELGGPLAWVGLFLGWQAAIGVAVLAGLLLWCGRLVSWIWARAAEMPALPAILAGTLLQVCLWGWLSTAWFPGPAASFAVLSVWAAAAVGLFAAGSLLTRRSAASKLSDEEESLSGGLPSESAQPNQIPG